MFKRWFLVAAFSCLCWIVCEVVGGLFFLSMGLRLWNYEIMPAFWGITSPVIWLIAFILMPPIFGFFVFLEQKRAWKGHLLVTYRLTFLISVGCFLEVAINELFFKRYLGRPLFIYTVLPTFEGSGSLLSPLYYSTLYLHFPLSALHKNY